MDNPLLVEDARLRKMAQDLEALRSRLSLAARDGTPIDLLNETTYYVRLVRQAADGILRDAKGTLHDGQVH